MKRIFRLSATGNLLSYELSMAAVGQSMQLHLDCKLHKDEPLFVSASDLRAQQATYKFLDVREPFEKEKAHPIEGMGM